MMPTNGATSTRVRALGPFETFFEASFDTLGAFNLTALYTLSRPITLAQLQTCADKLRARHRILQVSPQIDWQKRDAFLQLTPRLRTHVEQYEGPLTVAQHLSVLTDGDFSQGESDEKRRQQRIAHREVFLPWSLYLSPAGDHVAFSCTHSICDGASCEIIGADIVRCLNGDELGDVIEIPPTLEAMFGEITIWDRVKGLYSGLAQMVEPMDTIGLDSSEWSRDFKTRKPIVCTMEMSMGEMERFHGRCKAVGVSLTSGMISTFYEIIGSRTELDVGTKQLDMVVAMDGRRRLAAECKISHCIGSYSGFCVVSHDVRAGKWSQRAREIHAMVHGVANETAFKDILLPCWTSFVCGEGHLFAQAYGRRFGRRAPLMTSNLGRAERIERANEAVADGEDAVRIERMRFDLNNVVGGSYFMLLVCTVGNCVSVSVKSYEPFVRQSFVDGVGKRLRAEMTAG